MVRKRCRSADVFVLFVVTLRMMITICVGLLPGRLVDAPFVFFNDGLVVGVFDF